MEDAQRRGPKRQGVAVAHELVGLGAGHGPESKEACATVGGQQRRSLGVSNQLGGRSLLSPEALHHGGIGHGVIKVRVGIDHIPDLEPIHGAQDPPGLRTRVDDRTYATLGILDHIAVGL
jgi:hypothetical protein